jgi:transposase
VGRVLRKLRREGKEYREIAKMMGVTHTRIFRKLNNKIEYPYSGQKKKGGENLDNVHEI